MSLSREKLFFLALLLLGSACTRRSATPIVSTIEPKWLRWSGDGATLCASDAIQSHPFLPKHACLTDEGLARAIWSGDRWRQEPRLAKTIEPVTPKTWRIELREDLKWSDGAPLTAADVAESWKQVLQRCRRYGAALETFGRVAEAAAFCANQVPFSKVGIEIAGPKELRIRLVAPTPDFPLWLTSPAAWPFKAGAGAGPFVLSSEAAPNETRFPRNPHYWGARPPLDGVRLQNSSVSSTHRIKSFLAGETDAVDGIDDASAATLAYDGRLKFFPTAEGWFLVLSPSTGSESQRRSLLQNLDAAETASLLRWPHYRIDRLTAAPEEAAPPAWAPPRPADRKNPVAESEDAAESERHSPLLKTPGSPSSNELSANLQAQWMRRLSLSPSGLSPGWIVVAKRDPLHPERNLRAWLEGHAEKWGRGRTRSLEDRLDAAAELADGERQRAALDAIEKELMLNQALVLPLLGKKEPVLVDKRVAGLSKDALGNWDFGAVDLEDQNQ